MSVDGPFTLAVPLDATQIEEREHHREVKVLLQNADGDCSCETVRFDKGGHARAEFTFERRPGGLEVIVGPADASDEQLVGMRTITSRIAARAWSRDAHLAIEPIVILPYFWYWWWRWCRTFTIRGTVVCADGRPVPGAKVCARDVDFFWWWTSLHEVGCATTDVNGAFEIKFTWCCGFWPWWWWATRAWQVDPVIAERIQTSLREGTEITSLPAPTPTPDLAVFDRLLGQGPEAPLARGPITDPAALEPAREALLKRLPQRPDLESQRIWPWWPWRPWTDCTPDITFNVTQDCGQGDRVILAEDFSQIRWDIPTTLNVVLVAASDACCVTPRPICGEAECIAITKVCDDLLADVGGNFGAPAAPVGYLNPGSPSTAGDRPYAEVVTINGVCGDWTDYYEFEISSDGGATWGAMPPAAAAGFSVRYVDKNNTISNANFPFTVIDGRNVIESIGHWESVNGAKPWIDDTTILMNWLTTTPSMPTGPTALFADGTYALRMKAYQLIAPGDLGAPTVPPQCGTKTENRVDVTIDNRMVGPGAGHPSPAVPAHGCGGVHFCTTEPDTDVIAVMIDGLQQDACSIVDASKASKLEIDFTAYDPDGHLAFYTLDALWGVNNIQSLLPGAQILGAPPGVTMPGFLTKITADQAGPGYGDARLGSGVENTPAAVAPTWAGGTIRLTIPDLKKAFPVSCCYLLDLYAYKRTIDGCYHGYEHYNRSTFTLTVQV